MDVRPAPGQQVDDAKAGGKRIAVFRQKETKDA
jgi:hypothetical protein